MTDKKCEHDIGFTSWHKGNCLAGKTAFPRCPYCPKPKGDEMKSPSEIVDEFFKILNNCNKDIATNYLKRVLLSERKRAEGLREALKNLVALCWKQVLFPKTYRAFNDAESTLASYEGREEGKEKL